MKNNNAAPSIEAVNQSENHYTDMQTVVPAVVMSTGYAPDGEYYAEVIVFNTETNKHDHAFVRFSDERELASSYVDMYENTTKALGAEKSVHDAKTLMKKSVGKRDLFKKFAEKATQAQESEQFSGQSIEQIIDEKARNSVVMLSGITIVGESNAPDLTGGNGIGSKDTKVLLLAANKINVSGLFKDNNHFKNDNLPDEYSPVADEYPEIEQAMVRMIYDTEKQESEAYKILASADTMNIDSISKNPTPFLEAVSENVNPTSSRVMSAPRQGFMDLTAGFNGISYRVTLPSNHLVGGEHFNKSPEEYLELSEEWDHRGEKEAVSRYMAGQDPYSNSKNPDPDIIAKSDMFRLGLQFASNYGFAKEFSDKIKSGDKNAYKGVTKFDYLSVPKDKLTAQQQVVLEFSEAVVNDPKNTFLSIVNYEKLNLPTSNKQIMSEAVKASVIKATDGTGNNAVAQTAAARTAVGNSMLDIARRNLYEEGKVNMIVIPATIVTDVAATEATLISHSDSEEKEVAKWGRPTSQFYPTLSAVSNPIMNGRKYDKETRTFYSHTPVPTSLIKSFTKKIDFHDQGFQSLGVLMGQALPADFQPDRVNNNFTNAFNHNITQPPKEDRLGYAKVANHQVINREQTNNLELTPKQLIYAAKTLSRKEMFHPAAENNPVNDALAKSRYSEFEKVMKELVGPFNRENTTISHLRLALNSPKGTELSEQHQKIHDMLLTDKLVELTDPADQKDKSKSFANFKDLALLAVDSSAKMDSAIRADINGDQIKVETQDLNTHKQNRVVEAINQARETLTNPSNNVSASDLVSRAMEATEPRPTAPSMSPTHRF